MLKRNAFELVVGALVLLVAAVFCLYAYAYAGVSIHRGGYAVDVFFGSVDGLSVGSDVRISGIKIGSVVSQTLDKKLYRAHVGLSIDQSVQIPADSSAKITSFGIFGQNYISITPGGSKKMLQDGGRIIYSQGSIDLISLVGRALFGGGSSSGGGSGPDAQKGTPPASSASVSN